MSKKSNINYKYLRRRQSWFRRNLPTVIIAVVAVLLIAAAVVVGVVIGKNSNKKDNNDNQATVKESTTAEETSSEVEWITEEEPETTTEEETVALMAQVTTNATTLGSSNPYFIKVNRAANCVTVYGIDTNGEYTIPVIAFASSCGREGHETPLVENYKTSDKYEWRLMVDGTYGMYATRIAGTSGILFHSVPYLSTSSSSLEEGQYNMLGDYASLGCVRLCVRDCKWIYDNCPSGTGVTIYDDATNPGPLGKPDTIKVPEDSEYAGWDPTDPSTDNPWNNFAPAITGAKDITTTVGQSVNLLDGVTATDTCGNDATSDIYLVGTYTYDQAGTYAITYKVRDALGRTAEATVNLIVE